MEISLRALTSTSIFVSFIWVKEKLSVQISNQKSRFIVLPVRPEGTEGWSEDQLAEIVTRDCLIGVAVPKPGKTANDKRYIRPAANPYGH